MVRQLGVRQAGLEVMDPVERFMQQGPGNQFPSRRIGHDASGRASRFVAAQAHVLDVFSPALQVAGNEPGHEVVPPEEGPEIEASHQRDRDDPEGDRENQLGPDLPPHLPVLDGRVAIEEPAPEQERREEETEIEFEERRQSTLPSRRVRLHERPQFHVLLGRQVHVVRLVQNPVKGETGEAQDTDQHAFPVVEVSIPTKHAVRCLVEPDQHAVHQVTHEQGERNHQPPLLTEDTDPEHELRQVEGDRNEGKSRAARPRNRGLRSLFWGSNGNSGHARYLRLGGTGG